MVTLNAPTESVTEEWLNLETAVELIGQMIGYYVYLKSQERQEAQPDQKKLDAYEAQIDQLGQERRACYRSATKPAMIDKAFQVYSPFLRQHAL